jgi:hypothetical protein
MHFEPLGTTFAAINNPAAASQESEMMTGILSPQSSPSHLP